MVNNKKAPSFKEVAPFILLAIFLIIGGLYILRKPLDDYTRVIGNYQCIEISSPDTKKKLPLTPLEFSLTESYAKCFNPETKKVRFEGNYTLREPPRHSVFKGSDQINIEIKENIFRPMIYYYKKKIYFLDTTVKEDLVLYIFKKMEP